MRFVIRLPRLPEQREGMLQATLISAVLHIGTAGLVFVALGSPGTAPVPLPVYTVSLVEAPPGGATVETAAQPPPAEAPDPPPEEESSAPLQAVPDEPPQKKPERKPPPKEKPEPKPVTPPAPRKPAVPDPAPQRETPAPTGDAPPATTGSGLAGAVPGLAGDVPTIDSDAFQFGYYRSILTNRLRSTWSRPLVPGGLQAPIRATVHFIVLRSGAISDVGIAESSGYAPLDRSALRSVYDANPLPPLPEPYQGERLAVNFFFELTPER